MKTFIILSTLAVVALAQYGSVATAADSTATQVTYAQVPQFPFNPYPYHDPYYRHHRQRHGRHHRRPRPHSDSDSSEEQQWGWARDDFVGYHGYPYQPYPFQYQRPIYTVQTTSNNAAADSTSYGTASDTVAAAPATYGSK